MSWWELAAPLADPMSHTTSGKERATAAGTFRWRSGKRGAAEPALLRVPRATAATARPPPAGTGGPKQRGTPAGQPVIINSHCSQGFGKQAYVSLMLHKQKKKTPTWPNSLRGHIDG